MKTMRNENQLLELLTAGGVVLYHNHTMRIEQNHIAVDRDDIKSTFKYPVGRFGLESALIALYSPNRYWHKFRRHAGTPVLDLLEDKMRKDSSIVYFTRHDTYIEFMYESEYKEHNKARPSCYYE